MGPKRVVNFSNCCIVVFLILADLPSLCSSPIPLLQDFLNHKSSALPSAEKGQLSPKGPTELLGKQIISRDGQRDTTPALGSLMPARNSFNLKSTKAKGTSHLPVASSRQQSLMKLRVSRPSTQGDLNLKPASNALASSGPAERPRKQPWDNLPIKPQPDTDGESGNSFNLKSAKSQADTSHLPVASRRQQSLMKLRVSRPSIQGDLNLKPASNALASSGPAERPRKQPWDNLPIKPQPDTNGESGNIPLQFNVNFDGGEQATNSVVAPQTKPTSHTQGMPLTGGLNLINLGRLPLKTDWCTKYPFKEIVHHNGCESREIDNNMCYGQCNSFYIPKRFISCSYCTPSAEQTRNVRLECPGQYPPFVNKKVKVVLECACKDCGLQQV